VAVIVDPDVARALITCMDVDEIAEHDFLEGCATKLQALTCNYCMTIYLHPADPVISSHQCQCGRTAYNDAIW